MPEAHLEQTDHGAVPAGEGWFVVNVRDARWFESDGLGLYRSSEGENARFLELGVGIGILRPGEPNCMYHAEEAQEDFLVLSGECLLRETAEPSEAYARFPEDKPISCPEEFPGD